MSWNPPKYRFRDLEVWQLGMKIVHEAYALIKKFPSDERFGLADQFRRAAVSIVLNIVEGSGQPTNKGFIVYIFRSRASLLECVACLDIALQEKFVTEKDAATLSVLLQEEYFKLTALAKSIEAKKS